MKRFQPALSACLAFLLSLPLLAVTHDDTESLIPEFYIQFKGGNGVGTPTMTVTFDAYDEYNQSSSQWVTYSETTGPITSTANAWSATKSLYITKGVPLDVAGALKVSGNNIAEYKIFINVPDSKYTPCAWVQVPPASPASYEVAERYMIHKVLAEEPSLPLPHEHEVFFKRAGDNGASSAKAGSAMPGWRNFKMGLGYGKSGNPLGYVTFWKGNEPRLSDISKELYLVNYSVDNIVHDQLYTPQMTYDFVWDETYLEAGSGFAAGAYLIHCYDNATQPGQPSVDGGGHEYLAYPNITPVVTYILNYSGAQMNQTVAKTKIKRTEGNWVVESQAQRLSSSDAGYAITVCYGGNNCSPSGYCFPPSCVPRWIIYPKGILKDYSYDWITTGFEGERNCRFSERTIQVDPNDETHPPTSSSIVLGVGLGVPGQFSRSRTDSGKFETSSAYQTLAPGQYFWPNLSLRHDSVTGSGLFTGNASYYWNPGSGSHLKLKYQIEPGGNWTYYEYEDALESRGMVKRITKPHLDGPATPAANVAGALVTEFTYAENWDKSRSLPAEVVTKLKGAADQVIARTVYDYTESFVNGNPIIPASYAGLSLWVTRRHDYFGPGLNDKTTTVTKRFRPDVLRFFANLPFSEERADGTKCLWDYQAGLYNEATRLFTPDPNDPPKDVLQDPVRLPNAAISVAKISCFPSTAPGAQPLGIDNSYVVPNRSTSEVITRDKFGRIRRNDTSIYVGGANPWQPLSSEVHDYDPAGNLIRSYKLMDGENPAVWELVYEAQYTDRDGLGVPTYSEVTFDNTIPAGSGFNFTGRKQYERDRSGVIKKFYYDKYARVNRVVELQPPSVALQPPPGLNVTSPPRLQTHYLYDADNRVLLTSIGPLAFGDIEHPSSLVTSRKFNLAGLPTEETAPGGYVTTIAYNVSGRATTKTLKGRNNATFDRTIVMVNYRDGRIKSTDGTAAIPEFHSYSVETVNGVPTPRAVVSTGSKSAHTKRGSTNDFDWVGRVIREAFSNPDPLGPTETAYTYNSKGQLIKTLTSGLAPVLREYDQFGQLFRSGIKLAAGGDPNVLNLASSDRISEQATYFTYANSAWWEVTVNKTYPTDNSSTPFTVQETYEKRSGWRKFDNYGLEFLEDKLTSIKDSSGSWTDSYVYLHRERALTYIPSASDLASYADETFSQNGRKIYHISPEGVAETFEYDNGRPARTTTRIGSSELTYRDGSTEVIRRKAPDNTWTRTEYDAAGRVAWQKVFTVKSDTVPDDAAAGKVTRYLYNKRGQVEKVWGDIPYPIQNFYYSVATQEGYDLALTGELYEQHTYNGGTWTGLTWPSSVPPNKTRFIYNPENGLLREKKYNSGGTAFQKVSYTYNKRRDLKTRAWDRGITTTYYYKEDNTGELEAVQYSDSTPALGYSYNRLGALSSVTDAASSRSFSYRATDQQLDYQNLPSGTYGAGLKLGLNYDVKGRMTRYWFGSSSASPQVSATYQYDPLTGRLATIGSALGAFDYTYLDNSSLISYVDGPFIDSRRFVRTCNYADDSNLLKDCSASLDANPLAAFAYRYDDLHRLTRMGQTGTLFQHYGAGLALGLAYNDRNELKGATNYLTGSPDSINSSTPKLPRREFAFNYDNGGNRTSTKVDTDTALTYTPNILGQYISRGRPTFVEANGLANKNTTISAELGDTPFNPALLRLVLSSSVNDYFYGKMTRTAPTTSSSERIDLTSTLTGLDIFSTESRTISAASSTENFTYDTDGNVTDDAIWHYTYDGENRVKQIETKSSLLTQIIPGVKVIFVYDFLGRRIKKEAYNYTGGTWNLTATYLYLYEGLNLIAEFQQEGTTRTLTKSYYWGIDLSGSIQGAGGVGGLLGIVSHTVNPVRKFAAVSDPNGNIIGLLDLLRGHLAAEYEYTPFGEPLRAIGTMATANPWRFSSKYFDSETGLLNFGYRYYSPSMGRFINRDPLDESGRLQLGAPLGGGAAVAWSHVTLVRIPGQSPGLTPDTSLGRASLPHSNERQGGYRNSTEPGNTLANRKGNGGVGRAGSMKPSSASSARRSDHLYAYVRNNPYNAIDPLGLADWGIWNPLNWANSISDNLADTWENWRYGEGYQQWHNDNWSLLQGAFTLPGLNMFRYAAEYAVGYDMFDPSQSLYHYDSLSSLLDASLGTGLTAGLGMMSLGPSAAATRARWASFGFADDLSYNGSLSEGTKLFWHGSADAVSRRELGGILADGPGAGGNYWVTSRTLAETGPGNWMLGGNLNLTRPFGSKGGFEGTYTLTPSETSLFQQAWGLQYSYNPYASWKGLFGQYYYRQTPYTTWQRIGQIGEGVGMTGAGVGVGYGILELSDWWRY